MNGLHDEHREAGSAFRKTRQQSAPQFRDCDVAVGPHCLWPTTSYFNGTSKWAAGLMPTGRSYRSKRCGEEISAPEARFFKIGEPAGRLRQCRRDTLYLAPFDRARSARPRRLCGLESESEVTSALISSESTRGVRTALIRVLSQSAHLRTAPMGAAHGTRGSLRL
jgi:hypothetical protein